MLFFRYTSPAPDAWSVDLGAQVVRLGSMTGLTSCAELGAVGSSSLEFDDPSGNVGHTGDAILGLKSIEVDEGDATLGNRRVWTGYIGERRYTRGHDSHRTGAARTIEVSLKDLNAIPGFRILTTTAANRPSETAAVRVAWLLSSGFCAVYDKGYVFTSDLSVTMDATDYRGQTPENVLADCALACNVNWFIYYHEASGVPALWIGDSNYREDYTSTLRISNVAADYDGATTFAPSLEAELRRSPDRVVAGVFLPYAKGVVYETRAATANTYAWRDRSAPNANVGSAARASAIATNLLYDNSAEDDRITVSVEIPNENVNDVHAGQRLQVKFSHLPGYEDWRWCRVLRRTVVADLATPDVVSLDLELSPQPVTTYSMAYLMRPNDSGTGGGSSGPIWWDHDGDNPKPGDDGPNQAGYLAYYPVPKPGTGWTGIEVSGSGVVDISVKMNGIEAFSGVGQVTISVRRNGTTVGSQTLDDPGGPGAHVWIWTADFDVADVYVTRGDILDVYFSANITSTIPNGVGAGDHHFSASGYLSPGPP